MNHLAEVGEVVEMAGNNKSVIPGILSPYGLFTHENRHEAKHADQRAAHRRIQSPGDARRCGQSRQSGIGARLLEPIHNPQHKCPSR